MTRRQYIQTSAMHIYAANPNGGPAGAIERAALLADHLDSDPATAFEPEVKRVELKTCGSCFHFEPGERCGLHKRQTGAFDLCNDYQ